MMNRVKLIAFYLPQYHPIPENDRWWGKGFTEWTNVSRGRPLFDGHYQPKIPADLGFYDLRLDEVRTAQAELARQYGIHGFCYYYYWFGGKKLLERPIEAMLRSGQPDFPFCICWANENWTRRWDGAEQEVLIKQHHSPESDERFIRELLPYLCDPRYIRVNGAPLILVYRAGALPDAAQTIDRWRTICREKGIGDIHVAAAQTFNLVDPRPYGCDSAVEFPPHGTEATNITRNTPGLEEGFSGNIYSYESAVHNSLTKEQADYTVWPGVMLSWDNSPRRGKAAHIYDGASPEQYESWLRGSIERAQQQPGESLVFINAWNEWAEGTHLEPDKRFGHGYLRATKRALTRRTDWREALRALRERPLNQVAGYLDDLEFTLLSQERALSFLSRKDREHRFLQSPLHTITLRDVVPKLVELGSQYAKGQCYLDRINQFAANPKIHVDHRRPLHLTGWGVCGGLDPREKSVESYIILDNLESKHSYYGPLRDHIYRQDVVVAMGETDEDHPIGYCGFGINVNAEHVPEGRYRFGVVRANDVVCAYAFAPNELTLRAHE